jgi:hypothetical protein
MIISIEAENTFDKIQHLFMINPEAIRIIRIILQLYKGYVLQINSEHYAE